MLEIALTVDDLPEHGDIGGDIDRYELASLILSTFKKYDVPSVCGFVNGIHLEKNPGYHKILQLWTAAGHPLGNHTYSHPDIRHTTVDNYLFDIKKNEECLSIYDSIQHQKFFRYPYLREGETNFKFAAAKNFLTEENYINAPATIDFSDYLWNTKVALKLEKKEDLDEIRNEYINAALIALEASIALSRKHFGRDIKHILLLHLGISTALFLDDVLKLYLNRNCRFISLSTALTDPIYKNPPETITEKGLTLLGRLLEPKENHNR